MHSILSVTEARRTKVWWKSGPQCYYLYLWSIKKYFSHYRVSQKWSKFWPFFLHFLKLLLFAFNIERHWGQKNKNMVEIRPPVLLTISLEYQKIFVSLQGVQKNCLNFDLFLFIFWNCHFLPSILSVTEARRTKVWWKSGPQCYYLYLWSIEKNEEKNVKI